MTLRPLVIEAMAEGYAKRIIQARHDDEITARELRLEAMTAALDAALSVLSDHADEWYEASLEYPALRRASAMLAVLADHEEDE